jgi:hypothetical protein
MTQAISEKFGNDSVDLYYTLRDILGKSDREKSNV